MANNSGSTQSMMTIMEERPANYGLGYASRKKAYKEVDLKLDVFNNPTLRAYVGWEKVPQPWSVEIAM